MFFSGTEEKNSVRFFFRSSCHQIVGQHLSFEGYFMAVLNLHILKNASITVLTTEVLNNE